MTAGQTAMVKAAARICSQAQQAALVARSSGDTAAAAAFYAIADSAARIILAQR